MKNQMSPTNYFILLISIIFFFPNTCFSEESIKKKWNQLLNRDVFVYTIPQVSKVSTIDGSYVRMIKEKGELVPCRRCPDWLANPGNWKLNLNKGTYRIINMETGWKSIGTYVIAGDRIIFANDPSCIYGVGIYSWNLIEGKLTFELIDDPCAIKLRAKNLTKKTWSSCMPPNIEAAVSEHWNKPLGCE